MFLLKHGKQKTSTDGGCGSCLYFDNEPLMLEDLFKGINILSSVHGCSRGDAGICKLHGRYLLPSHVCSSFSRRITDE